MEITDKSVAVVVTYNKLDMLKRCVTNLLACTEYLSKIVIINNASTDNTADYLATIAAKEDLVYPVNEADNLGGAAGFNAGIKEAMKFSPAAVWVMDDDCIVDESTISALYRAKTSLERDGVQWGELASNVRWTDGKPALMNVPKIVAGWNDRPETDLVRIEHSSFVSMFINAAAVQKFGYPITDFFIWGDDLEYSQRIAAVLPSYCVTSSKVVHDMAANTRVDIMTDSENRIPRYFYDVRNNFYIAKHTSGKQTLKFVYGFVKKILKVLVHGPRRTKKIGVLMHGFFAGIIFNPSVEIYEAKKVRG